VQEDIMITDEQVAFYRDNGYLVVENVLSPTQVAALRREVEEMVAGSAEVQEHTEVYDLEETHTPQRPRVRRIKTPHRWMSSVDELVTDPKLVGILTRLVGPGVRFQTSKLNMKAAGFGAPVEWHQDWAFYPHTNDDLLAVGVMLDDVDAENGPMLVMPGSHRGPVYDHHHDGYFCGAIDPQTCDLDISRAVAVTAPAGSMSFHHVRLLHGSALNRSAHDRRLLLLQYTAVDAWPLVRPVQDITAYDNLIVAGEPTVAPRLAAVPVRLPLPSAPYQGSIYENQRGSARRYFDTYQETVRVGS
jgi:phytanoyl-CoA hydroxylase